MGDFRRSGQSGAFRGWLRAITRNKIGDEVQEDGLLAHRALELVRAEFEDRTWQAFWRVAAEGRPPADIADELGMTLHAVYKAKSRVLCRLRRELGD